MTIDEKTLTALETLANNATPGPWWAHQNHLRPELVGYQYVVRGARSGVCESNGHAANAPFVADVAVNNHGAEPGSDAAFICASREAVPALVAEVRRLRREVERLRVFEAAVMAETRRRGFFLIASEAAAPLPTPEAR